MRLAQEFTASVAHHLGDTHLLDWPLDRPRTLRQTSNKQASLKLIRPGSFLGSFLSQESRQAICKFIARFTLVVTPFRQACPAFGALHYNANGCGGILARERGQLGHTGLKI